MEEQNSAASALTIAINTLRERCLLFQQRIAVLEEENLNLRLQCSKNDYNEVSWSEVDSLKQEIMSLTEQKNQLQNKIKIVSSENKELWRKLGKLSSANKDLGSHLSKINDSLKQHAMQSAVSHSPLIRSKTFTQDHPQSKLLQQNLEDNGKISLELEDISLKLTTSINREKHEFESLIKEISEIQNVEIITSSLGICYDEELDDTFHQIEAVLVQLKSVKDEAELQNRILKTNLKNINNFKETNKKCENCENKNAIKVDNKGTTTQDLQNDLEKVKYHSSEEECLKEQSNVEDKICPVCSKQFPKGYPFQDFVSHVEMHFTESGGL